MEWSAACDDRLGEHLTNISFPDVEAGITVSQEKIILTRKQILGARAVLEMTQEQLARAVGISERSLNMIEQGKSIARPSTLEKLRVALEQRGIEFTNGGEPGVKLRPSKAVIPV